MRPFITPIILIAITFIWLSDNSIIFPIIAVILFIMAALIDKKYPKIYYFESLSDKMPFGMYEGRTIKHIIEVNSNYANWLFTRSNVKISDEIRQAHEKWRYLAQ